MENYVDIIGKNTRPDKLKTRMARDLANFILSKANPFVRFVGAVQSDDSEMIIADFEVDTPQLCAHDIRPLERIAIAPSDKRLPEVAALRADFPQVPHLNLRTTDLPRSLCLFTEGFETVRSTLTPARLVERIRWWLSMTARGKLHHTDQPLEPLIGVSDITLVLPHKLRGRAEKSLQKFRLRAQGDQDKPFLFVEEWKAGTKDVPDFVTAFIQCEPRTHGVIRRQPTSLADLQDILVNEGTDLLSRLREALKVWNGDVSIGPKSRLLLILELPKRRTNNGPVEGHEFRAFLSKNTVNEIGCDLGLWEFHAGKRGVLLQSIPKQNAGGEIPLLTLNIVGHLSAGGAARMNGLTQSRSALTAIGCGALGSQVIVNMVRAGQGDWSLIDHDRLQPHNLARHALTFEDVGLNKAEALLSKCNGLFDEPIIKNAFSCSVFEARTNAQLRQSVVDAELILDFSASVPVARFLARDIPSKGRRVSVFLNPSGSDLVLLAEDVDHSMTLDQLEFQYYRAIASMAELDKHFDSPVVLRYGQTCRDISSTIPQSRVAIFAGIASEALIANAQSRGAAIQIWKHQGPNGGIAPITVTVSTTREFKGKDWTVITDEHVLIKLQVFRGAKLPNETGGVLIGSFDVERKLVYLVDVLPSPADSKEYPALYIRGVSGLKEEVARLGKRTNGMLDYIGEWHSHPNRCSLEPSRDDRKLFQWLRQYMATECLPPVMAIVGDRKRTRFFIETIE